MTKVLFICHGNICRSPMGEFVLKDMVRRRGLSAEFEIASAAVSTEEIGNPVYPPARRELKRHGIDCAGKTARQVTQRDLEHYDYIYYMDRSNARWLERMFPGVWQKKCRPLLERDVADPWYTGDFSQTWDDIVTGCERILAEL
ncbi:MAG: low molecular weight phosphotyrosine protein phosphatase [Ruminococcaceae bacterium]|nr:low molecular weight phosphotyrosine protein phosphatase [Oscillospiraceae bacterium]